MISIIIPVYNTEKYLKECLDSILKQTYRDIEIILVNDGSTDHSLKICYEYQNKDTRIRVFDKKNTGVSSTRNFGLKEAKGEYISFCDSDDIIVPQLYEKLMIKLLENDVDRVCGGYSYLYSDGHVLYCKPRRKDGKYSAKELLPVMIDDGTMSGFLFSGVNNSIFKKEIINKYNIKFSEQIKYNEDSLFSFEYMLHSENIYSYQSESLYLYRQHTSSSTAKRNLEDNYIKLRERLKKLINNDEKINLETQLRRRNVTETFWKIMDIVNKLEKNEAIKKIKLEISKENFQNNLKEIKVRELNKYKYIFYIMLKLKIATLLYITLKKIVPILSKYLSR